MVEKKKQRVEQINLLSSVLRRFSGDEIVIAVEKLGMHIGQKMHTEKGRRQLEAYNKMCKEIGGFADRD